MTRLLSQMKFVLCLFCWCFIEVLIQGDAHRFYHHPLKVWLIEEGLKESFVLFVAVNYLTLNYWLKIDLKVVKIVASSNFT